VLAAAVAQVVAPARRLDEARRALADVPGVEIAPLDLMDPASIDAFATAFLASGRPLDRLVNCAAIMASPLMRDARGHEAQFSTNHLGHFQLALRLWPALQRAGGARIVAVSSRGHQRSAVDFDDVDFERRPYDRWAAYGQSKTANALFAVAADALGRADGIRAFAVHPGSILTNLTRHLSMDELRAVGLRDENGQVPLHKRTFYKTVPEGAATIAWCAAGHALEGRGGVYCDDLDIAAVVDRPSPTGVCSYAIDPALADRLWEMSEALTGAALP
jgi:NAD(P)-dependent dehydrogenase (short-subunit alcohol dehydrogenase family)